MVALSCSHEKVMGICIFKEEDKEIETKGRKARGERREARENPGNVYAQRNNEALHSHNGQQGASGSLCGQSYTY